MKINILDFQDDLNECLDCGYMSTAFGELYDNKGKKITSWNKTDNVVCPKCKSFNYFLKQEEA
jgi:predicted nucleic-acid-binding Zn-ribbon protein